MKRLTKFSPSLLCAFALLIGISATAANLPSDWQHEQSFERFDNRTCENEFAG